MEKFEQMKALLEQTQGDLEKFFNKGNSTAGTRVRKAMQELKDLAQDLRKEIQETKNAN
jgi:DNA anti-recombination protein RmuC